MVLSPWADRPIEMSSKPIVPPARASPASSLTRSGSARAGGWVRPRLRRRGGCR